MCQLNNPPLQAEPSSTSTLASAAHTKVTGHDASAHTAADTTSDTTAVKAGAVGKTAVRTGTEDKTAVKAEDKTAVKAGDKTAVNARKAAEKKAAKAKAERCYPSEEVEAVE